MGGLKNILKRIIILKQKGLDNLKKGSKMIVDLTQMQTGCAGIIVDLQGGHGLVKKLLNIGIRPGKKITKISSHFWKGPQTIQVDNVKTAIGYGMAKKIFVEVAK